MGQLQYDVYLIFLQFLPLALEVNISQLSKSKETFLIIDILLVKHVQLRFMCSYEYFYSVNGKVMLMLMNPQRKNLVALFYSPNLSEKVGN